MKDHAMSTVHYEWDVELVTTVESDDFEAEEVIEHDFCASYKEAYAKAQEPAPEGHRYDIVLVRTSELRYGNREWAYINKELGALPEYFADANEHRGHRVPMEYHKEVSRLNM